MAVALHTLVGSVLKQRRRGQPATHAELLRASQQLATTLRLAGLERGLLLEAVAELGPVTRLLRSLTREHRRIHGRTHAVRVAEAVMIDAAALQYDTRPMGRYLPEQYLRTRLWAVARSIERARIALRWEQMEGER